MTFYDAYKAKLSVIDANPRTYNINNTKRVIANSFKDSPSYYQVQVNTSSSPSVTSNLDTWIVDDSNTKELKKISLMPNQTLNFGDVITWQGEKWLATAVDDMGGIYYCGSIQKCVSSLKWMDSNGAIQESWFTLTTDLQRGLGLNEGSTITVSTERRYIAIQRNSYTSQIEKLQRFIFDNGRCWRVVSINSLLTNLIILELEETLISETKDNIALRIADYYIHDYSIHISNGNSVNLSANDTLQLDVVAKDHGTITSLPVTYSTSDSSIATVSNGGLITAIANGTITIRASLTNDPNTYSEMSVNVSDVVESGWTLDISGSDFCKIHQIQKFTGTVKNNGVTDTSKLIRWTLYDDSGSQPTTLGTIISQSGHDVVIQAGKYTGHVKIKGTCYAESNFTVEDIAAFTVADLSAFTVDQLASVGLTSQDTGVQTVDSLFNLGLTVDEMATLTVSELAMYTVGDLENEAVLVSAVKRVQIIKLY